VTACVGGWSQPLERVVGQPRDDAVLDGRGGMALRFAHSLIDEAGGEAGCEVEPWIARYDFAPQLQMPVLLIPAGDV
jgi:hypothetical protein